MIYLDTSIVAPLYWAETLSDAVEELVPQGGSHAFKSHAFKSIMEWAF